MQDDVYSIALDGWRAGNEYQRLVVKGKKGKDGKVAKDKEIGGLVGVEGRMIAPQLLIKIFFSEEKNAIATKEQLVETAQARLTEIEEENAGEEGLFADLEKVNATEVAKLLKERQKDKMMPKGELEVLKDYLKNAEVIKKASTEIKNLDIALEKLVIAQYSTLPDAIIKDAVLHYKWKAHLQNCLQQEQERISQNLTQRIKLLAERYATTLVSLDTQANEAATKVKAHLQKMGWSW
ncbi:hypothetical protein ACRASX_08785 [Flavobacterium sp. TMP13]|uniref:hypothetical protein n=1 Tax=Flavobacterium sp. TMP13 TaxID=3425950 RepID=UPI003D78400D